jgi:hypothetical protein
MQKVITFEDDGSGGTSQAKGDLPASVMKTVCNEEAGKIVLQFLVSHTRGQGLFARNLKVCVGRQKLQSFNFASSDR